MIVTGLSGKFTVWAELELENPSITVVAKVNVKNFNIAFPL
jgi:hypothetical protein